MEQFPKICWPDWEIVELLGSGAYGRVYKIKRDEKGIVYYNALKIISIPKDSAEVMELQSNGLDYENITEYYKNHADKIFREIAAMMQLDGVANIVGYKDHKLVERENGIGYEIFIRMELLTSLPKYLTSHEMDTEEIVRMGIDLCRALEICEKKNIIHRDIKPANIFVSDYGDFELGDFGISRVASEATMGTVAGTYSYMAPEIYQNQMYDCTVDMYSLGLVLYQYLNGKRLPFMPPAPEKVFPGDSENALVRRMKGESIPPLNNVSPALSSAICKACSFDPKERFRSISDMRSALEDCLFEMRVKAKGLENADEVVCMEIAEEDDKVTHDPIKEDDVKGKNINWNKGNDETVCLFMVNQKKHETTDFDMPKEDETYEPNEVARMEIAEADNKVANKSIKEDDVEEENSVKNDMKDEPVFVTEPEKPNSEADKAKKNWWYIPVGIMVIMLFVILFYTNGHDNTDSAKYTSDGSYESGGGNWTSFTEISDSVSSDGTIRVEVKHRVAPSSEERKYFLVVPSYDKGDLSVNQIDSEWISDSICSNTFEVKILNDDSYLWLDFCLVECDASGNYDIDTDLVDIKIYSFGR